MLSTKELYEIYKEYAWREYDILERRMNWLYLVNSLLLIAVGLIAQEHLWLSSQADAFARVQADTYASKMYMVTKLALVVVPTLAILFNFGVMNMMQRTFSALDGLRRRWRTIRIEAGDEGEQLPFATSGMNDLGPRTMYAFGTILPALALMAFWLVVALTAAALVYPNDFMRWFWELIPNGLPTAKV